MSTDKTTQDAVSAAELDEGQLDQAVGGAIGQPPEPVRPVAIAPPEPVRPVGIAPPEPVRGVRTT